MRTQYVDVHYNCVKTRVFQIQISGYYLNVSRVNVDVAVEVGILLVLTRESYKG